jgi:(2Fe-2S) ferredoxin
MIDCNSIGKISHPVTTKRLVIGQVSVCFGCCCGQTPRGKPAVPVEWLKNEWRSLGLLKNIQLTISGCLGPCDVPNVVLISTADENIWLGNIDRFEQYREIVDWAARSKAAGRMLPVSKELLKHRLDPFR